MRARTLVIGLMTTAALLGFLGGVVLGIRLFADPGASVAALDPAAGLRAQQRLAELLLRQSGASSRTDPIVIEAAELNALLAGHVRGRQLPLQGLQLRAEQGWFEVSGHTTIRHLLGEAGSGGAAAWLPGALLDLEVRVGARGRVRVENGQGAFIVEGARIGRQAVSTAWLWPMLGDDARRVLSWRVPRIVERVDAAPGRVVIHTRARGR